jgi:hypothetical protein
MRFNQHSQLAGKHAFLSASKSSWVNYDEEKLDRVYVANMAAQKGTDLHQLANDLIRLGVKLPDRPATTMNLYVNDGIGFRMKPEQTLFYSVNCFGTCDTIAFRKNKLRIHDLKTGLRHTSERQLEVYAALFCLEYGYRPHEIDIELRIYQNDEARIYEADPDVIETIMEKIVAFDKRINQIREDNE